MDSAPLYHGVSYGMVWACLPCGAWVGVHRDSADYAPLGGLANADLRKARIVAHACFDKLWKAKMRRDKCEKSVARGAGYKWLATQLGIPAAEAHIGKFDLDMCNRTADICNQVLAKWKR